jgi:hypothetical protein
MRMPVRNLPKSAYERLGTDPVPTKKPYYDLELYNACFLSAAKKFNSDDSKLPSTLPLEKKQEKRKEKRSKKSLPLSPLATP